MQHEFNIYPALFILTPVMRDQAVEAGSHKDESEWTSETERYFTSCPQTYYGNCLFNASQAQLMFGSGKDAEACPIRETIDGKMNVLEPAKFKGSCYTITYIPVPN